MIDCNQIEEDYHNVQDQHQEKAIAGYRYLQKNSRNLSLLTVEQTQKGLPIVPIIQKTITKKKNKITLQRKMCILRMNQSPWIRHTLSCWHSFFIRGDLIIDIERLLYCKEKNSSYFVSNEHKPVRDVRYFKANNFFQLSFEDSIDSIQDFRFVIQMLNSLGNQRLHQTALILEKYLIALNTLDELKKKEKDTSGDCCAERFEVRETWTYKASLERANKILAEKLKDQNALFYLVLRGQEDCREVNIMGIKENTVKLILGNVEQEEMTRILLKQGLLFMSPALQTVAQNKLDETIFFVKNDSTMEPEHKFVTNEEHFFTANNYTTDIAVSFEQYKLSSYANKFNDYLFIGKIAPLEQEKFMKQLFIQKLFCEKSSKDTRLLLSDLRYQAKSEYFLDTFYQQHDYLKSSSEDLTNTIKNSFNQFTETSQKNQKQMQGQGDC